MHVEELLILRFKKFTSYNLIFFFFLWKFRRNFKEGKQFWSIFKPNISSVHKFNILFSFGKYWTLNMKKNQEKAIWHCTCHILCSQNISFNIYFFKFFFETFTQFLWKRINVFFKMKYLNKSPLSVCLAFFLKYKPLKYS